MAVLKDLIVLGDASISGIVKGQSFIGDGLLAATNANRNNTYLWNTNGTYSTAGSLNVDMVDGKHASDFVKWAGNQSSIGSGSPFSGATGWTTTTNLPNGNAMLYNSSGTEYSMLFALNPSNLSYGTILRWGYNSKYLYIGRKSGGAWQTTDWEKISAGYADSAGVASNLSGGAKGSIPYQTTANTTSMLAIGTEGQVLKVGSGGTPYWATDSNDDVKVTQTLTNSGNTDYRPLILGYSSSAAASPTFSSVTNTAYATHQLYVKPSTGDFYTKGSLNATGVINASGGTMSGLLNVTTGSNHSGIKAGDTYINSIEGNLIFQNNSAIRFGGDSWNWDVWAGLKYSHSSKRIYLGLADGNVFTTNNAQTGGTIYTPGIDNIYIGNGTYKVWHAGNDGSGSTLDADLLDGIDSTQFVKKQEKNHFYPFIATENRGTWYKVTLAHNGVTSGATKWFMLTMELVLGGSAFNGTNGKIFLTYYFSVDSGGTWSANAVYGIGIGSKLTSNDVKIKYDLANPAIFYVYANNNQYNSFAIENLTANDTAPSYDYRNTTIAAIAAADIPSTANQTVPITKIETTNGSDILLNGNTVAGAAFKGVVTAVTSGSTNLPTSQAVYNFVTGQTGNYLPLSGGTMTGDILVNSGNTINLGSSTKYWNNTYTNKLYLGSGIIHKDSPSLTTVWNTSGGTIDLKTKGYEYAGITKTGDTRGHWNADLEGITSLYDGLVIHIKLSTAYYNNGENYNTLNVNNLGAKIVWYRYNSRSTSHFSTNSELRLTYRTSAGSYTVTTTTGELTSGTTYTDGWIADYAYYDDSVGILHYDPKTYKVGDTGIPAYNPIGENKDGLLVPMLTKPFLVGGPMYIYSGALSANYTGSWTGLYYTSYSQQIRNGSNYVEGVAYKPLYLKGTISGGMFTTDTTTPYVTALPTTEDGFCYYYLGETTTSTAGGKYTYISFRSGVHPVYVYRNGQIHLYEDNSDYLPLAGGIMTGTIKRTYTASNQTPFTSIIAGNYDNWLWRIGYSNHTTASDYGFGLKYIGTGDNVDNRLRLYADNQGGSQLIAVSINQSGQIGIKTDSSTAYTVNISGDTNSIGNIVPDYAATYSLGTSSKTWLNAYTRNVISDSTLYLQSAAGTSVIIRTNGANERMRIDSGGNVGIGTTSPSYKLHISGDTCTTGIFLGTGLKHTNTGYTGQTPIKLWSTDGSYKTGDTGITSGSTDSNFPTSKAVYGYVSGNYLPLAGGQMTGAAPITFIRNKIALNFSPSEGLSSKVQYMSTGNEALVFANQNNTSSFIFKNGHNLQNGSDWQSTVIGTPSMQIRQQSVAINYAWDNNTNPTHNLRVGGTGRFDSDVTVSNNSSNAGCRMTYDATVQAMKFVFD